MGNIGDYGETRKNFRWNVPDDFNFGRDVVDRKWYFMMVAGNKIGAIVIPCSDQLRPKDPVYRALHSGASTIVGWDAKTAEVDEVRKESRPFSWRNGRTRARRRSASAETGT